MKDLIESGNSNLQEVFKEGAVFDAKFWFRQDVGLEEPQLYLPEPRDPLYVLKAIGAYEP